MDYEKNDDIEIDIKQLFFVLLGKIGYIIMAGVVLALVAYLYFNFAVTKQYSSNAQIYVINKTSDSITSSDVAVSTSLSADYVEMITTRPVMEQVIAELGLDMTSEELASRIEASVLTNSRIISITATDPSPIAAKRIVDCVTKVSAERICTVMDSEMVNVVQEGNVAKSPSAPATTRNAVIAFMLGAFVAAAIIIVRFITDDTISTTEDIEKYLKISVIGTIPVFDQKEEHMQPAGKAKKRRK